MSKRILVVEDQADNRQIIRDMLTSSFDVEIAMRNSAFKAAQPNKPKPPPPRPPRPPPPPPGP
jgi:CheY-like chemotaxis protein